jgi:hypothetical protein
MKTCKQIKLECAHDFMNDWKEWYYYILDVMFKNMESNNPVHETKTKVWANNVLKQKFNHILSQHVLCLSEMKTIFYEYMHGLDEIHNKVLHHILDKNKN